MMWCVNCALRCESTCSMTTPDEKPKLLVYICTDGCGEETQEERFHHQRHAPTTCFACGGVAYYDETQDEVEAHRGG